MVSCRLWSHFDKGQKKNLWVLLLEKALKMCFQLFSYTIPSLNTSESTGWVVIHEFAVKWFECTVLVQEPVVSCQNNCMKTRKPLISMKKWTPLNWLIVCGLSVSGDILWLLWAVTGLFLEDNILSYHLTFVYPFTIFFHTPFTWTCYLILKFFSYHRQVDINP